MNQGNILIVGARGQLGKALQAKYPNAKATDVKELDITNAQSVATFDWSNISIILNAAAYTNVDGAETSEGRVAAWKVNATAVGNLVRAAQQHQITLLHISTDYVFDGTNKTHSETENLSPLSVYGASKAAGDLLVQQLPKHYILRTSWVIGDGHNFVRTMLQLGQKGVNPTVVADQIGRLTFTTELVAAIDHLLDTKAPYGTYNVTNDGPCVSWAAVARAIYKEAGMKAVVTDTSTEAYFANKTGIAPRPLNSSLDLAKIQATGFTSTNWQTALKDYLKQEANN